MAKVSKVRVEVDRLGKKEVALVATDTAEDTRAAMDLYQRIKPAIRKFGRAVDKALQDKREE